MLFRSEMEHRDKNSGACLLTAPHIPSRTQKRSLSESFKTNLTQSYGWAANNQTLAWGKQEAELRGAGPVKHAAYTESSLCSAPPLNSITLLSYAAGEGETVSPSPQEEALTMGQCSPGWGPGGILGWFGGSNEESLTHTHTHLSRWITTLIS